MEWPTSLTVALAGAAGGLLLGLSARVGRFCTLAAIEDAMFGNDRRRLRMWALALGIAILSVSFIGHFGWVDFSRSTYNNLSINPAAWILGGLLFGFGMALCGTCGFGTLARVGGGDLRALFDFLVIGIAAYMAIAGPSALFRQNVLSVFAIENSDWPRLLAPGTDGPLERWAAMAVAITVGAALLVWCFKSAAFRRSRRHVTWAAVAGGAIVLGWLATGIVGADPFEPQPLTSFTFSVPLGQTVIYLMTMSSTSIGFGVGGTLGVMLGAFAGALLRGEFRWEAADDAQEMRRHLCGAFLMGTGGVWAGGCTIGQGLSAASLLALSAPIVMLSIWCGVWLGLTYMMEGSITGGLRALFGRS